METEYLSVFVLWVWKFFQKGCRYIIFDNPSSSRGLLRLLCFTKWIFFALHFYWRGIREILNYCDFCFYCRKLLGNLRHFITYKLYNDFQENIACLYYYINNDYDYGNQNFSKYELWVKTISHRIINYVYI